MLGYRLKVKKRKENDMVTEISNFGEFYHREKL